MRGWTGAGTVVRSALPVVALALGLGGPSRSAAQAPPPPAPALIPVVEAYTAAWNAQDLPAVLTLFAADAAVRERREDVPAAVWDTRNPQAARAYRTAAAINNDSDSDPGDFLVATGRQEIAAWAAARFAQQHRFAAGPYRTVGDTVSWSYREFVDPFQLLPGVGPREGDAEAVVRGDRITLLSFVLSLASVQRQRNETVTEIATAAAARAEATRHAAPLGDGSRGRPRDAPGADPAGAAWPLALGGLALLAGVTAALRRRRVP